MSRMSSPISRRSIFSVSRTTSFRSSTFGSSTVLRLKASNWRVSEAARSPASLMALTDSRIGSLGSSVESRMFTVAGNDGQQVVEVVGHAAGQLADRLHLLRLVELRLQRLLLGHVLGQAKKADELAVVVHERRVEPLAGDGAPVLGQVLVDRMGFHVARPNALAESPARCPAERTRDEFLIGRPLRPASPPWCIRRFVRRSGSSR